MKILLKKHFGWFYEKLNNDAIDSYAAQGFVLDPHFVHSVPHADFGPFAGHSV